ncbi:MAG: hypothetical protein ACTS3F_10180 [Phycisphaerales bacterium]
MPLQIPMPMLTTILMLAPRKQQRSHTIANELGRECKEHAEIA